MKNVTMRDIAMKLNISTVTVSKALSDKDGVSEELRDKIKSIAEEMGYRYNSLAKGMKEGKSYNIGVIIAERYVGNDVDAFYMKMYQNVVKALSKSYYYGIMEIVTTQAEKQLVAPNIISDNKADGIIILGQMNTQYLNMVKKTKIPMVFLDFFDESMDVDSVISDGFYGTYFLTNHVISKGHSKIGFVGNIFATNSILDRYLGYYKSLILNKLEVKKEWVINDRGENGEDIEFELPKEMPTAFVCNCDSIAYLFIESLKKHGYKIPQDISVVGFDNSIYGTISSPQLTTIEVDVETMAETAVNAVMLEIQENRRTLGRKVIHGNLIIRDSVADISKDMR